MDVLAGGEGRSEAGVTGEVGDGPQLDLVVVGHQEAATRRGDEGLAEAPTLLGAHRDVVQIGAVRGQPAGSGHGLAEGGMDAAVGPDFGGQALPVGGSELLHLAVAQQGVDDRMLAAQQLERAGVGREPGLGLAERGEAEPVVEDGAELRHRVDVERDRRPVRAWWPRASAHSSASEAAMVDSTVRSTGMPTTSMRASTRTSGCSMSSYRASSATSTRASASGGRRRARTRASRTPAMPRGVEPVRRPPLVRASRRGAVPLDPFLRCRRRRRRRGSGRPGRRGGSRRWRGRAGRRRRRCPCTSPAMSTPSGRSDRISSFVSWPTTPTPPLGTEPGGQGGEHPGILEQC